LGGHKNNAHKDKRDGELVIDASGGGRHAGRQPPGLGDEEVCAGKSNQPDNAKKNEAHLHSPLVRSVVRFVVRFEKSALLLAGDRRKRRNKP
jgi:hypothetical protein